MIPGRWINWICFIGLTACEITAKWQNMSAVDFGRIAQPTLSTFAGGNICRDVLEIARYSFEIQNKLFFFSSICGSDLKCGTMELEVVREPQEQGVGRAPTTSKQLQPRPVLAVFYPTRIYFTLCHFFTIINSNCTIRALSLVVVAKWIPLILEQRKLDFWLIM